MKEDFSREPTVPRNLRRAVCPPKCRQCSVSFNSLKGTLRGLHFQAAPHAEDKLVRCTAGAIFDVIVDLRPDSPTLHRWFGTELTAVNRRSLFIPKGFAHGFLTLQDDSEVFYMMSVPYAPGFDRGVRWNDPALGIRWPIGTEGHLSARRGVSAAWRPDAPLSAQKRVLVTGAGGFIGRCEPRAAPRRRLRGTCRALEKRAFAATPAGAATPPGVEVYGADLLDPKAVEALIEAIQPTHLLHFAWIATPGVYWNSSQNYDWLAASRHLLDCFCQRGGRRAVMAGSCAEYDWSRVAVCNERSSPLSGASGEAMSAYAECKIAMCRALEDFGGAHDVSTAWGRIFFQYGPGEHPQRLVASVIIALLSGGEALCTHGRQIRSYLHVADVGAAFAAILDSDRRGTRQCRVWPKNIDRRAALACGAAHRAPGSVEAWRSWSPDGRAGNSRSRHRSTEPRGGLQSAVDAG